MKLRWLLFIALSSGLSSWFFTHVACSQLMDDTNTLLWRIKRECQDEVYEAYQNGWRNAAMGTCASSTR